MAKMKRDFYTARLRALDGKTGFPYLSSALLSLIPVFTDKVPTLATDPWWRIYINPGYFETLTDDEGAMVIVHEVWHHLGEDWRRAEAANVTPEEGTLWNWARDMEINSKEELKKRLPKPMLPEKFNYPDDKFAEEYLQMLRRDIKTIQVQDIATGPGCGACGSLSPGVTKPWENPAPGHGGGEGHSQAKNKLIQASVAQAIIEHASKGQGNIPAGWIRWAKKIFKPQVNWLEQIYHSVKGAVAPYLGSGVTSGFRIGRREPLDPRVPSQARLRVVPKFSFIIDTSGSMSDDYIGQAIGEVAGVIESCGKGAEVDVHFTDAVAAKVQRVKDIATLRPIGGGGTNMCEGYDAIERESRENPQSTPDLIVCITDGYTDWPANPPTTKSMVIILGPGNGPPWINPPRHELVRIRMPGEEDED